jgi:hypothetical protein
MYTNIQKTPATGVTGSLHRMALIRTDAYSTTEYRRRKAVSVYGASEVTRRKSGMTTAKPRKARMDRPGLKWPGRRTGRRRSVLAGIGLLPF